MGCFAVQKTKKKVEDASAEVGEDLDASPSSPSTPTPSLSGSTPSFRKTVRAIQHAQRFIVESNPNRSILASHGASRDHSRLLSDQAVNLSADIAGGGTGTGTHSRPLPLPSPREFSPKPAAYVLPHPSDHGNTVAASPHLKGISSVSVGHSPLINSRVYPSDLQPLPPLPKESIVGSKSYTFDELASACQQFSTRAAVGDDGFCFAGAIKTRSNGNKGSKQQPQQQAVVVMRLHEKLHLGLKEWLPELLAVAHHHNAHLCKPLGFYSDDARGERFLVYERLHKGSLHNLMFEVSADTPPLDWPSRMKILQGAIQGLATLHEKFPEQTLYKDFRLSHIQVDSDKGAKLSGYWFVTSNNQTLQAQLLNNGSKARDNAYCAPETRRKGVITLKSHVWSLGVVMLEILCGRRNREERTAKDEKHNLVKWAEPFLLEEDKLFLIMDPKLQGRFPSKGAKIIAALTLQCLQKDPTRRPSMKEALDMVKAAQEKRHTSVLTRRNRAPTDITVPSSAPLLSLEASQFMKPIITDRVTSPFNRSPTKFDLIRSPVLRPISVPSRSYGV